MLTGVSCCSSSVDTHADFPAGKRENLRIRSSSDGEGQDSDKEDRQLDSEARDFLEEKKRATEEGQGALYPVRCGSRCYHLLKHRQALRLRKYQVGLHLCLRCVISPKSIYAI